MIVYFVSQGLDSKKRPQIQQNTLIDLYCDSYLFIFLSFLLKFFLGVSFVYMSQIFWKKLIIGILKSLHIFEAMCFNTYIFNATFQKISASQSIEFYFGKIVNCSVKL